jgi:hypothetical protein
VVDGGGESATGTWKAAVLRKRGAVTNGSRECAPKFFYSLFILSTIVVGNFDSPVSFENPKDTSNPRTTMTLQSLRILVIGGYGVFGSRLIRLLADVEGLTLLVAGRSKFKAEAFCQSITGRVTLLPEFFDRDVDVNSTIESLHPDIVVDAAGPFQNYGDDAYRMAEAALGCGADYIDLADATDFVCGVHRLDLLARERGRFVISGASTCPSLTAAVVRHITKDLKCVTAIEAGIAPSPHVQVGLSVIRALTSYAGRPLQLIRDGKDAQAVALVDSRRHVIAPPGIKPLAGRLFSLVDVPDLQLLPSVWPELKSIWFGAGTVPVIQHRMFVLLAWLSSIRVLPSLRPLAPLLYWMHRLPTWGKHRGGMYVVIDGIQNDGTPVRREWDLIAEGDDGSFIPAMAAAAIIRKYRNDLRPGAGARPALQELEYADFEHFFAQKKIVTGVRDLSSSD